MEKDIRYRFFRYSTQIFVHPLCLSSTLKGRVDGFRYPRYKRIKGKSLVMIVDLLSTLIATQQYFHVSIYTV